MEKTIEDYLQEQIEEKKRIWNYILLVAADEKNKQEEYIQFRARLQEIIGDVKAFIESGVIESVKKSTEIFYEANYAFEKMNAYFALDEDDPETPQTRETLKELDITEKQFSTISFLSTGKHAHSISEFLYTHSPRKRAEKSDFDKIRDEGIKQARHAVMSYKDGDKETFGILLGSGLSLSCANFSGEGSTMLAMQWSLYTKEILDIFDKKPDLLEASGLRPSQIQIAREVAKLGDDIRNGLEASDLLAKAAASPDMHIDKKDLAERIAKMHAASNDRTIMSIQKRWYDLEIEGLSKPEEKPVIKDPAGAGEAAEVKEEPKAPEKQEPVVSLH